MTSYELASIISHAPVGLQASFKTHTIQTALAQERADTQYLLFEHLAI